MSWNTKVRKFPMCAKSYTVGPQEYIRTSPAVCGTNASFFPLKVLWRTISAIESTPALLESKTNSRFYLSLADPPIERHIAAQFPSCGQYAQYFPEARFSIPNQRASC